MRTEPILPTFTAQAARESDRLSRKLSQDEARTLLARIESKRRAQEVADLRGQIEEMRLQIYVTRLDPNHDPERVKALRGVLRRAQAMYAAVTGSEAAR